MSDPCSFVEPLLRWWRSEDRIERYPWRKEKDPYRILVAELLLQRTRRDAVMCVYERFFEKFPTAESLSRASEEDVKEAIKSLGLSKRARYLIAAARSLIDGAFSKMRQEKPFHTLGVGKYSRAMLLTSVFGAEEVAVDRNVARVLCRIFGIVPRNPKRPQDDPTVNELARRCAPWSKIRDYNLALLDLGWEVCLPKNPKCADCPLRGFCNQALKADALRKLRSPPFRDDF